MTFCYVKKKKKQNTYCIIFMCIETGHTSIIIAVNIIYVQTVCSELYKSNKTTCPCSEGPCNLSRQTMQNALGKPRGELCPSLFHLFVLGDG